MSACAHIHRLRPCTSPAWPAPLRFPPCCSSASPAGPVGNLPGPARLTADLLAANLGGFCNNVFRDSMSLFTRSPLGKPCGYCAVSFCFPDVVQILMSIRGIPYHRFRIICSHSPVRSLKCDCNIVLIYSVLCILVVGACFFQTRPVAFSAISPGAALAVDLDCRMSSVLEILPVYFDPVYSLGKSVPMYTGLPLSSVRYMSPICPLRYDST